MKRLSTIVLSALVLGGCTDEEPILVSALSAAGAGGASAVSGGSGGVGGAKILLAPEEAAAKREACSFEAGTTVDESTGAGALVGAAIPIEHVVILMLENRSFDHMFQRLADVGITDADVAPDTFANPDANGVSVPMHRATAYCFDDTAHGWLPVHAQLDGDAMDGFVQTNASGGKDGTRAIAYLGPNDAPFAYWLAQNATIGDRYFSSLPGSTWPNRAYFYAASSFGLIDNSFASGDHQTIFEALTGAGVDFNVYRTDIPGVGAFLSTVINYSRQFVPITQFAKDAAAGTLPPVSYIDPMLNPDVHHERMSTDEHPPADHQYGEQLVYDAASALATSPLWPTSALIITYDEHGGLYDHVPPPPACPPDDIAPPADMSGGFGFDRLGVRVPLIVFSAYARPGFVTHTVYDHTSVLRFLEAKFGLGALTRRDANATPLTDAFDFVSPPRDPPVLPPRPTIDQAHDDACKTAFP